MFEREIAVNHHLLEFFGKVANDVPEDSLFHPSVGHGHPPIWILGHLAICAEMGQSILGGTVSHPEWISQFGPASTDIISPGESLSKNQMVATVTESYRQLRTAAGSAKESSMSLPHHLAIFQGSPIKTIGDCITLLLTSHFGFHLAQLSSCRRTAGFGPLF